MPETQEPYVTVTYGMRGWFAVIMHLHVDGFWEPWDSGIGSYSTAEGAAREGKQWAKAEELKFIY